MPARPKTSTTHLPSSLLDQIRDSETGVSGTSNFRKHRSQTTPSRKESRRQLRAERKQKKAVFFSSNNLKRSTQTEDGAPLHKKPKLTPKPIPQSTAKPKSLKAPSKLESFVQKKSKPVDAPNIRSQQEKREDTYITFLEGKLRHSKGNKMHRFDDGLDDLFDFANSLNQHFSVMWSLFNLTFVLSIDVRAVIQNTGAESEGVEEDLGLEEEELTEEEDEDDEGSNENEVLDGEEGEWNGIQETGSESEAESEKSSSAFPKASSPPLTTVTRYVPPQLRAVPNSKKSEGQIKLTRQVKGLLNRMSEQNIASILDSIEEIYRNHRRQDVTSTITSLIIDGISSHSTLLDSYVVLYAAFVSSLRKVLGIEFAAYFLQNVVLVYEKYLSDLLSTDKIDSSHEVESRPNSAERGKEASNLAVLLSELYNFQVISCILIYDVIRALLVHDIKEFQVELLLKILRNSGQQLRTDDPHALKDIIQAIQNKLQGHKSSLTSRTHFMIETLDNLKNNKVKRLGAQNQGGEAVERMKKFLSGLSKKRHVLAHEPLRVSLEDLHSAETKGKWWLVGAAWGGDPLVDRQQDGAQNTASSTSASAQHDDVLASNALLKLAKKHGMNTDIRRSIFVLLMSSDDYVDAYERLSQLKLTGTQQREIVRVVLHCCGNEKVYNPYYTLVCQHLCSLSHSHKITLQYCLWDFLRELGETNTGGAEVIKHLSEGDDGFGLKSITPARISNMARAYAWWIAKGSISLAVLKPLDFTTIKPQTRTFLKHFFLNLFVSSQSISPLVGSEVGSSRDRASIEEIFTKAGRLQTLAMGLMFFISKVLSIDDVNDPELVRLVKWGVEIAKDTLRSGLDIVPDL
ncbi:hypothetical protein D9757_002400 [Collybiopsis confluens]|uniref:MI domain-containing protein n=1 Tax=Collybiopsis confluens TaxID=2823264 RepID=A0A8H5HYC3_9AGAR|nr:hypothetical protein D9757_002400 [Collybiopsis confluens]